MGAFVLINASGIKPPIMLLLLAAYGVILLGKISSRYYIVDHLQVRCAV